MFVHMWRMRAKKKRVEVYEKFGRQVTMPALKKIPGCIGAYFVKVFEARKPEYLWVVLWQDEKSLEAARNNPVWKDQIRKFEAGNFYKTVPLELVCESLASFSSAPRAAKSRRVEKVPAAKKELAEAPALQAMPGPIPAGE